MNVASLGPLRLGPKAHPNDGLIDVTEGTVPFRHRREAAKRALSGSHLPHPDLTHRRVAEWQREFSRPASVWLDGVSCGRFRSVRIDLVPDGLVVVG
jgi:diacylglycerol kinase family enzyme